MGECSCPREGHTDECVAARTVQARAAQGLPPTVTDPAALARVASIVSGARQPAREVPA